MPNSNTFNIPPINKFIQKYFVNSKISIDPFAKNSELATYTNDINTETKAKFHLDAIKFMEFLTSKNVKADLIILDPPYSPRQMAECYKQVGRKTTQQDTQITSWSNWKYNINNLISKNGIVLTFGWNTVGMGKKYNFQLIEILLVCHGSMHNDTICVAERKI